MRFCRQEPCSGVHGNVARVRALCAQVYRDDDTILSWDLINEPRCDRIGCDADMLAWIEEMAPYVKALDGNHLLTVGALRTATRLDACTLAGVQHCGGCCSRLIQDLLYGHAAAEDASQGPCPASSQRSAIARRVVAR